MPHVVPSLRLHLDEQHASQVVRAASCCLLSLGFVLAVCVEASAQAKAAPTPTPATQRSSGANTTAGTQGSATAGGEAASESGGQSEGAARDAERAAAQLALVDRLTKMNRNEEARRELRRMMGAEDFDPVRFYNIGNRLARLDDSEGAIEAYRKAIAQRRGNYARAQNNLGVVLMRVGRWDEAYEAFTAALRSENFLYAEASYNLGRLHALRGETELAARELRRALTLQPDHSEAKLALARLHAAGGDTEQKAATLNAPGAEDGAASRRIAEAQNSTTAAAQTPTVAANKGRNLETRRATNSPPSVAATTVAPAASPRRLTLDAESSDLLQRARAAREKARYEEAVTLYHRLLARHNSYFAPANLELGYALISLKRYEEATGPLEAVTVRDGARYPIVYYHLGRLYELRGRVDQAGENFARAAAALGDKNPQFMLDVSRVRERQGNLPAALAAMEAYVQASVKQGRADEWAVARVAALRQKLAASTAQK